jgi:hypothetical protein
MKRWFLWTFWCLRGRRCAKLEVTMDEYDWPLPASADSIVAEYTCGGCGTHYRGVTKVKGGLLLVGTSRERIKDEQQASARS